MGAIVRMLVVQGGIVIEPCKVTLDKNKTISHLAIYQTKFMLQEWGAQNESNKMKVP